MASGFGNTASTNPAPATNIAESANYRLAQICQSIEVLVERTHQFANACVGLPDTSEKAGLPDIHSVPTNTAAWINEVENCMIRLRDAYRRLDQTI